MLSITQSPWPIFSSGKKRWKSTLRSRSEAPTVYHCHPLILRSLLIGHPHGWLTCTLLECWRPLPSCTWVFSNLLNFVVVVLDIGPRVLFMAESERKYIINTLFFLVWVWRSLFITPSKETILLGGGGGNNKQRILGNLSRGRAILYFEIGSWPSFSSMGPPGPTFVFNVETCFKYLCPSTYCQYHPSYILYVLYVKSWTNIFPGEVVPSLASCR